MRNSKEREYVVAVAFEMVNKIWRADRYNSQVENKGKLVQTGAEWDTKLALAKDYTQPSFRLETVVCLFLMVFFLFRCSVLKSSSKFRFPSPLIIMWCVGMRISRPESNMAPTGETDAAAAKEHTAAVTRDYISQPRISKSLRPP